MLEILPVKDGPFHTKFWECRDILCVIHHFEKYRLKHTLDISKTFDIMQSALFMDMECILSLVTKLWFPILTGMELEGLRCWRDIFYRKAQRFATMKNDGEYSLDSMMTSSNITIFCLLPHKHRTWIHLDTKVIFISVSTIDKSRGCYRLWNHDKSNLISLSPICKNTQRWGCGWNCVDKIAWFGVIPAFL